MLLAARDEDGNPMSEQQLRDEVITLFVAGHETTANTLAWSFYLVAQHPDVEEKLLHELAQLRHLKGNPPGVGDLA
jgi:cytochrome P450